jgi:mycothiol system anti-sigma-R factor
MLLNLLTCKETLARLDDYLDRRLDASETRLVEKHLRLCHQCSRKFAFEQSFRDELRAKVGRIRASESLKEKIHAALNQSTSRG